MPVRLIPQADVEKELWARHCRKVRDYGTASLWKNHLGFHFVVPREPTGQTDENTLREILIELDNR
jgi:hypothetical protein